MTERRSERDSLLGVREERRGAEKLEFRKDKSSGQYILEGYAATYDPYDVHGGAAAGGWKERLSMDAFDKTLSEQPDVQLLINHTGQPLARTKSGTLKLTRDQHGLRVWASLDPTDPDVQALAPKMLRGDMDEMSFAFRVNDQTWDTSYSNRTINALSLEKGDVSVVNYGMNPGTRAVLTEAVGALASLSNKELVELRKLDQGQVKRAAAALLAITGAPVPPGAGSVRPAQGLRADGPKQPYGNVPYADPGYKADGKKRYPIDNAAHTKAAWSYINMPKNHTGYSAAQVSSIKGRIKTAAKKFGVDISDEKKAATSVFHVEQIARADGTTTLVAVMSDGSRVPLPAQRALPPADKPQPDAQQGDSFSGTKGWGDYNPSDSPDDPHDEPFEEGMVGTVGAGPVPDNIVGSGAFSGTPKAETHPQASEGDPHDVSINEEMLAMDREFYSMDPHDGAHDFGASPGSHLTPQHASGGNDPHNTPYDVGPQVGSVPNDKPNYGTFPQGKVADNIVLTGPALGAGSGVDPGTPPSVGTAPVDGTAGYDWTSGTISEPGDPPQQLGQQRGVAVAKCDDGHDCATHGTRSDGSWAPTNIEAGMGKATCDDDGDEDAEEKDVDADAIELDKCMAEALDRTIVHAYKQAEDAEVRKLLAIARRQLTTMRGIKPSATTDISRKLSELRAEVGEPDTATVAGGLQFLRSVGTAPVGFRGLLDRDPDMHVTSASERLAREAVEADRRARDAAKDSDKASERLKAARREAELNDVIRRRNLRVI